VNILVAGGFDPDHPELEAPVGEFCDALGAEIAEKGHVLLSGSRTPLDSMIATAAYAKLVELGDEHKDRRVISYVLQDLSPVHHCGTVIRSRLAPTGRSAARRSTSRSRFGKQTR
jgi:hypothetical protein